MKLWRRIRDEEGNSRLTEVTEVSQIDAGKPVVFVFPIKGAHNSEPDWRRCAAGSVKYVEKMLDMEPQDPDAEVLVVSYDGDTSHRRRRHMNRAMDSLQDEDADVFVTDYLRPLVEKNASVSMFGLSYGSVFAEAIRASYIRQERLDGRDDAAIGEALGNIYTVMLSNISNAVSANARGRDGSLDYSGIFFGFANDRTARIDNPRFRDSIPRGHRKNAVTIAPLTGNRAYVVTDAPKEMVTRDDKGKWGIVEDRHHKIKHIRHNHSTEFFMLPDDPIGLYPLVERAFYNMVHREGRPTVEELFTTRPDKRYASSTDEIMSLPQRADEIYRAANRVSPGWQGRVAIGSLNGQLSGIDRR